MYLGIYLVELPFGFIHALMRPTAQRANDRLSKMVEVHANAVEQAL
jgi:hypothetical protein